MNNKSFSLKKILTMAIFALAMGQAWGALADTTIAGKTYKKIGTCADLKEFSTNINNGSFAINTNAIVTQNIDCSGVTTTDQPLTPIGGNSSPKQYAGTFNGAGFVINNLVVNLGSGSPQYGGLFGYIGAAGVVEDVVLYDLTVKAATTSGGDDYVGGIAGRSAGKIIGCTVAGTATIEGRRSVGGIVGYADSGAEIKNCLCTAKVNATGSSDYDQDRKSATYVGGIVGRAAANVTVASCVYNGNSITRVDGSEVNTANVFPIAGGAATVENCYYNGNAISEEAGLCGNDADGEGGSCSIGYDAASCTGDWQKSSANHTASYCTIGGVNVSFSETNCVSKGGTWIASGCGAGVPDLTADTVLCNLNGGTMVNGECYGGDEPWTDEEDITNHGGVHSDGDSTVYDIKFDPNGGTFAEGTTPKVVKVKANTAIDTTGLGFPTRAGDVFKGWALTANASSASALGTATGAVTFYAVWQNSVIVSFDANGGTFPKNAVTTKRVTKNSETITAEGIDSPSLTGTAFIGWALTSDATEAVSSLGTTDKPITVYAVYTGSFTVSFNSNGHGTFAPGAVRTKTVDIGAAITADGIATPTAATGYSFVGWSLDKDATTAGSLGTMGTADVTVYAVWAESTVEITFNPNGGYFNGRNTSANRAAKTKDVRVGDIINSDGISTSTPPVAKADTSYCSNPSITKQKDCKSKDGYTWYNLHFNFLGWNTDKDATTAFADLGTASTAKTYYAIFSTENIYTITFHDNGHGTLPEDQRVVRQTGGSIVAEPTALTATGFSFGGWYTDEACTEANKFNFSTKITQDTDLYAKWTAHTNNLKFVVLDENKDTVETVEKTVSVDSLISTAPKTAEGYTYTEWSTTSDNVVIENSQFYMPDNDVVLSCIKTPESYELVWDLKGGTIDESVDYTAAGFVDYNAQVTAPVVTKLGYAFVKWTSNGTDEISFPTAMPGKKTTYYAVWEPITYTVTYKLYGATYGESGEQYGNVDTGIEYGATLEERGAPATITGYTFSGWKWYNASTEVEISKPSTMPDFNLLVKGVYEIQQFQVTFDGNGQTISTASQTIDYNGTVTKPEDPVVAGQRFDGWFKEAAGTNAWDFATDKITAATTLYAKWTPVYAVTYTLDGEALRTDSVAVGTVVTVADSATKGLDVFNGWTSEDVTIAEGKFTMPANDVSIAGSYTYVVIYRVDGVQEGEAEGYLTGAEVTLRDPVTKTGYTVSDWTTEDATITDGKFSMPVGDVVINATSTINQYTITFNSNGGSTVEPIVQDYNTSVTAPADPEKDGYVFLGWNKEIPATMPANDITITAVWVKDFVGTYDGAAHGIEVIAPEGATVTYSDAADGTYGDAATFNNFTNADTNTVFFKVSQADCEDCEDAAGVAEVMIARAEVTIEVSSSSKTYGEDDPAFEGEVTGLVNENDLGTITYVRTDAATDINVGTYTGKLTATYTANDNYTVTVTPADFTISPKAVTVTAEDKRKTFGEDDPIFTAKVEGLVGDDVIEYSLSREEGNDKGTYEITASGATTQGNYMVTYYPGTFTIGEAIIVLNAPDQFYTYNGHAQGEAVTSEVDGVDIVYEYNGSTSTIPPQLTDAGTIRVKVHATKENYASLDTAYSLVVAKATMTVIATAENVSKTYDGEEYTATKVEFSSESPLFDEDDVVYTPKSKTSTDVIAETAIGYTADDFSYANTNINVTFTVTDGSLEISPRAVVVKADASSKTYGEIDPELTATVTGLVGTDAVTYNVSRAEGDNVGEYVITPTGDEVQGNYTVAYDTAKFAINPKAVVVKADASSKTYGETDPELTATVTGLVGTDAVTYSVSRAEGDNIGEYVITPTGDEVQGNYTVAYDTAKFTINPKAVVVKADASSKTYGETDPELTATVTGLVGTDAVTYSVSRAEGDNIGEYVITPTGDEVQGNYTVAYDTAKFTINPKAVVVKANAASKIYGETDPEFTATVTGLVGTDAVTYSVSRAAGSDVGEYVITPTGDEVQGNYTVAYDTAKFTITNATIVLNVPDDQWYTYDGKYHGGEAKATTEIEGVEIIYEYPDGSSNMPAGLMNADTVKVKVHATKANYEPVDASYFVGIAKREVSFTGKTATEDYTGSEIELTEVTVDGLVDGHAHNVGYSAKGTEVGDYDGTITAVADVVINDASGNDVTKNYVITTTAGKLTVQAGVPTEIYVALSSAMKEDCTDDDCVIGKDSEDKDYIAHSFGVETALPGVVMMAGSTVDDSWTFQGWFDNADGINDGSNGNKVESIAASVKVDTTVYPYFTKEVVSDLGYDIDGDGKNDTVHVVIDNNDTDDSVSVKTTERADEKDLEDPEKPQDDGYTYEFDHYACEETSSGDADYNCKPVFTPTARTYAIAYELSGAGTMPAGTATQYTYGETEAFPLATPDAGENWTFAGWYKESAFTNSMTELAAKTFGDTTVYAKFTKEVKADIGDVDGDGKNDTITVVIDNNDTEDSVSVKTTEEAKDNDPPMVPADSTKDPYDYTFKEYVCDSAEVGATVDYTCKAVFDSTAKTYDIAYVMNGGEQPADEYKTYTYSETDAFALPSSATYSGWNFAGWYKESAFTNSMTELAAKTFGDTTVYAKFTKEVIADLGDVDGDGTNDTIHVVIDNNDTEDSVSVKTTEEAEDKVPPVVPANDSTGSDGYDYTFKEYQCDSAEVGADVDYTCKAIFDTTAHTYEIVLDIPDSVQVDCDGITACVITATDTTVIHKYGEETILPEAFVVDSTGNKDTTWEFQGWVDSDGDTVTVIPDTAMADTLKPSFIKELDIIIVAEPDSDTIHVVIDNDDTQDSIETKVQEEAEKHVPPLPRDTVIVDTPYVYTYNDSIGFECEFVSATEMKCEAAYDTTAMEFEIVLDIPDSVQVDCDGITACVITDTDTTVIHKYGEETILPEAFVVDSTGKKDTTWEFQGWVDSDGDTVTVIPDTAMADTLKPSFIKELDIIIVAEPDSDTIHVVIDNDDTQDSIETKVQEEAEKHVPPLPRDTVIVDTPYVYTYNDSIGFECEFVSATEMKCEAAYDTTAMDFEIVLDIPDSVQVDCDGITACVITATDTTVIHKYGEETKLPEAFIVDSTGKKDTTWDFNGWVNTNGDTVKVIPADAYADTLKPDFTKEIKVVIGDDTLIVVIDPDDTQDSIDTKVTEEAENHVPPIVPNPTTYTDTPYVYEYKGYECEPTDKIDVYECKAVYDSTGMDFEVVLVVPDTAIVDCDGVEACKITTDSTGLPIDTTVVHKYGEETILPEAHVIDADGKIDSTWEFAGWFDNDDGQGDTVKVIPAEAYGDTLYPFFTKEIEVIIGDDTITVVIDQNDTQDSINTKVKEEAENHVPPIVPNPSKYTEPPYEYTYNGYDCEPAGKDVYVCEATYDSVKVGAQYKIVYMMPKAAVLSKNIKSYTEGVGTILPTASLKGTDGWQFMGWYVDERFVGTRVQEIKASEKGKKVFYPMFQKALTYSTRDGSGEISVIYNEAELDMVERTLAGVIPADYTEGGITYTFDKWYEKDNHFTAQYVDKSKKPEGGNGAGEEGKTGLANRAIAKFQVMVSGRTLEISGAKMGAKIAVYGMDGRLVTQGVVENGTTRVELTKAGSYVVRVNNQYSRVDVH